MRDEDVSVAMVHTKARSEARARAIYSDIQNIEKNYENEIKKHRQIASGQVKKVDALILVSLLG